MRILNLGLQLASVVAAMPAMAAPYQAIHQFQGIPDGGNTNAGLIMDASGALYGTTASGGKLATELGTVFKLTPPSGAQTEWQETTLHKFTFVEGGTPFGEVLLGADGALYGTTSTAGGKLFGSAFRLLPPAQGSSEWVFQKLWAFSGKGDGGEPDSSLIADGTGALYGTTSIAGHTRQGLGFGTVFKLSPPAQGATKWSLETLHYFHPHNDGGGPICPLHRDASGNLFGTATAGGTTNHGVVFEVSPPATGSKWKEKIIWNFTGGADGATPVSGLVADAQGDLYGTTFGDSTSAGTVYELMPPANGRKEWTEKTLFGFDGYDGYQLVGGLTPDGAGGFYGTASMGGRRGGGVVFQVTPPVYGQSAWSERTVHAFGGNTDQQPLGTLLRAGDGTLFGTTFIDLVRFEGGVFSLKP